MYMYTTLPSLISQDLHQPVIEERKKSLHQDKILSFKNHFLPDILVRE